jgi:protein-S-isoprenylcysteine O-methyltransferase Ste14
MMTMNLTKVIVNEEDNTMIEYLLIVMGVTLFGLQHSGISALRIKNAIIERWGKNGYRNIFNATSIITLAISFFLLDFWNWLYFFTTPSLIQPYWLVIGIALLVVGLVLALKASQVISVSTVADMRSERKPELVTDGIYGQIRHPLYLATILMLLALPMIYPFPRILVYALSLIGYTMIGAYLEERKLIGYYGQEYLEYKERVGFLLPRF